MAQWTETLEPYIKVQERVKTATLNPSAGEDLIIGVALISDAGPSTPTLITSQPEFLSTYASQDVTQAYIEGLNKLYKGDDNTLASTMWANAYRLAGSNSILCVRASKANNLYFTKPLNNADGTDPTTYVIRDGEMLKKVPSFKITLNDIGDEANVDSDGWGINIAGVGIFGNRVTDDGTQYDYYCGNLPDLIDSLNDTSKFFCPDYEFLDNQGNIIEVDMSDASSRSNVAISKMFLKEVYLGANVIDTTDPRTSKLSWKKLDNPTQAQIDTALLIEDNVYVNLKNSYNDVKQVPVDSSNIGKILGYLIDPDTATEPYTAADITVCELQDDNTGMLYIYTINYSSDPNQDEKTIINLNDSAYSGFEAETNYAINVFNSSTELRVRIRRFNHNAVISKTLSNSELGSLTANGPSPWTVLTGTLDTFTGGALNPKTEIDDSVLYQDFYEIAIWDPSINEVVSFFNLGNILGRGDMEVSEVNDLLKMIQLSLPDNLEDLDLNYFGYTENTVAGHLAQIFCDLTIDPTEYTILNISDSDLKRALDNLALDEVYTTEGLCDLGNTELSYQNYMASMAINDNYFYPISTVNSTNYMTIGNSATKIAADSYKLYMSAPWDIDTGTLGWKFYCSPSVIYWETVAKNRRNNREFAPILGQDNGTVQYQRPTTEFNKKTRQLLLSRKVNTAMWDVALQAWTMNDNNTKQTENTIMNDEGNSRLMIRISKAMPTLLRQYIGKRISEKLCKNVEDTIDYFFKTNILSMEYNIDGYRITCKYDEILARQNKIKVHVEVRYQRALKYIDVFNDAIDLGMNFEGE